MAKYKHSAEMEAIFVREEKKLIARMVERGAKRDAWRLAKYGKNCPAHGGDSICLSSDCPGKICAKLVTIGLDAYGQPLRRRSRPICGANTRKGMPCQMRVEPGKKRCRLHGGLSTGPRTAEGRDRIAKAQRRRWAGSKEQLD